jgi:hypothetical protein
MKPKKVGQIVDLQGDKNEGVDGLKKRIIERANEIVHEIFPRKILKMNEIYQVL